MWFECDIRCRVIVYNEMAMNVHVNGARSCNWTVKCIQTFVDIDTIIFPDTNT